MTYLELELIASKSPMTLQEFTDDLWILLTSDKKKSQKLGKDLELFEYKNPANVFHEVMKRLTFGVFSELYS